ncbi:uncharacterized protein V1510DRAFT_414438 [Dipodascopsis tothii]|uniref:uncharacterized protein n=1 Tax=Dipodascopsis tothii TaxID=44089 RepID=UPI0034CD8FC4
MGFIVPGRSLRDLSRSQVRHKRRRLEEKLQAPPQRLARLDELPDELLQQIFTHSANCELPFACRRLVHALPASAYLSSRVLGAAVAALDRSRLRGSDARYWTIEQRGEFCAAQQAHSAPPDELSDYVSPVDRRDRIAAREIQDVVAANADDYAVFTEYADAAARTLLDPDVYLRRFATWAAVEAAVAGGFVAPATLAARNVVLPAALAQPPFSEARVARLEELLVRGARPGACTEALEALCAAEAAAGPVIDEQDALPFEVVAWEPAKNEDESEPSSDARRALLEMYDVVVAEHWFKETHNASYARLRVSQAFGGADEPQLVGEIDDGDDDDAVMMVPEAGELYVGSAYTAEPDGTETDPDDGSMLARHVSLHNRRMREDSRFVMYERSTLHLYARPVRPEHRLLALVVFGDPGACRLTQTAAMHLLRARRYVLFRFCYLHTQLGFAFGDLLDELVGERDAAAHHIVEQYSKELQKRAAR